MIGWKPFIIRWPAAVLPGRPIASGAITSASPIASTAHSSFLFIVTSLSARILEVPGAPAIRSRADPGYGQLLSCVVVRMPLRARPDGGPGRRDQAFTDESHSHSPLDPRNASAGGRDRRPTPSHHRRAGARRRGRERTGPARALPSRARRLHLDDARHVREDESLGARPGHRRGRLRPSLDTSQVPDRDPARRRPQRRAARAPGEDRALLPPSPLARGGRRVRRDDRPARRTGRAGAGADRRSNMSKKQIEILGGALERFTGGRLVVNLVDMPIKCPVAPLEFAFLADWHLRERGIRSRTELVYATPLDGAFTKPIASQQLAGLLAEKEIELVTEFNAGEVDGVGGK